MGQGRHQRQPNPVTIPAGTAHGLHFLLVCGGTWVHRGHRGTRFVLCFVDASGPKRTDCAGPGGDVYLYGCCVFAFISYTGKCRHGDRADARDGYPAAIDELWRVERVVYLSDARTGEQRSGPKVCELKGF